MNSFSSIVVEESELLPTGRKERFRRSDQSPARRSFPSRIQLQPALLFQLFYPKRVTAQLQPSRNAVAQLLSAWKDGESECCSVSKSLHSGDV